MLRVILASFLVTSFSIASWAQDVTYRKHIGPLVAQKCAACHGTGAPYLAEFNEGKKKFEAVFKGPKMDTYTDLITFVG